MLICADLSPPAYHVQCVRQVLSKQPSMLLHPEGAGADRLMCLTAAYLASVASPRTVVLWLTADGSGSEVMSQILYGRLIGKNQTNIDPGADCIDVSSLSDGKRLSFWRELSQNKPLRHKVIITSARSLIAALTALSKKSDSSVDATADLIGCRLGALLIDSSLVNCIVHPVQFNVHSAPPRKGKKKATCVAPEMPLSRLCGLLRGEGSENLRATIPYAAVSGCVNNEVEVRKVATALEMEIWSPLAIEGWSAVWLSPDVNRVDTSAELRNLLSGLIRASAPIVTALRAYGCYETFNENSEEAMFNLLYSGLFANEMERSTNPMLSVTIFDVLLEAQTLFRTLACSGYKAFVSAYNKVMRNLNATSHGGFGHGKRSAVRKNFTTNIELRAVLENVRAYMNDNVEHPKVTALVSYLENYFYADATENFTFNRGQMRRCIVVTSFGNFAADMADILRARTKSTVRIGTFDPDMRKSSATVGARTRQDREKLIESFLTDKISVLVVSAGGLGQLLADVHASVLSVPGSAFSDVDTLLNLVYDIPEMKESVLCVLDRLAGLAANVQTAYLSTEWEYERMQALYSLKPSALDAVSLTAPPDTPITLNHIPQRDPHTMTKPTNSRSERTSRALGLLRTQRPAFPTLVGLAQSAQLLDLNASGPGRGAALLAGLSWEVEVEVPDRSLLSVMRDVVKRRKRRAEQEEVECKRRRLEEVEREKEKEKETTPLCTPPALQIQREVLEVVVDETRPSQAPYLVPIESQPKDEIEEVEDDEVVMGDAPALDPAPNCERHNGTYYLGGVALSPPKKAGPVAAPQTNFLNIDVNEVHPENPAASGYKKPEPKGKKEKSKGKAKGSARKAGSPVRRSPPGSPKPWQCQFCTATNVPAHVVCHTCDERNSALPCVEDQVGEVAVQPVSASPQQLPSEEKPSLPVACGIYNGGNLSLPPVASLEPLLPLSKHVQQVPDETTPVVAAPKRRKPVPFCPPSLPQAVPLPASVKQEPQNFPSTITSLPERQTLQDIPLPVPYSNETSGMPVYDTLPERQTLQDIPLPVSYSNVHQTPQQAVPLPASVKQEPHAVFPAVSVSLPERQTLQDIPLPVPYSNETSGMPAYDTLPERQTLQDIPLPVSYSNVHQTVPLPASVKQEPQAVFPAVNVSLPERQTLQDIPLPVPFSNETSGMPVYDQTLQDITLPYPNEHQTPQQAPLLASVMQEPHALFPTATASASLPARHTLQDIPLPAASNEPHHTPQPRLASTNPHTQQSAFPVTLGSPPDDVPEQLPHASPQEPTFDNDYSVIAPMTLSQRRTPPPPPPPADSAPTPYSVVDPFPPPPPREATPPASPATPPVASQRSQCVMAVKGYTPAQHDVDNASDAASSASSSLGVHRLYSSSEEDSPRRVYSEKASAPQASLGGWREVMSLCERNAPEEGSVPLTTENLLTLSSQSDGPTPMAVGVTHASSVASSGTDLVTSMAPNAENTESIQITPSVEVQAEQTVTVVEAPATATLNVVSTPSPSPSKLFAASPAMASPMLAPPPPQIQTAVPPRRKRRKTTVLTTQTEATVQTTSVPFSPGLSTNSGEGKAKKVKKRKAKKAKPTREEMRRSAKRFLDTAVEVRARKRKRKGDDSDEEGSDMSSDDTYSATDDSDLSFVVNESDTQVCEREQCSNKGYLRILSLCFAMIPVHLADEWKRE